MTTTMLTPPAQQHTAPMWSFPTEQPPAPAPRVTPTVNGGGAAPQATVMRVRWVRVFPVLAVIALLVFGIWTTAARMQHHATDTLPRTVKGGGADAGLDFSAAPKTSAKTPHAPTMSGHRLSTGNSARVGMAAAPARSGRAATAASGTVRGGGTSQGELPMTGIETWIAGVLGVLLLAGGILLHVNAVRIAATAMLYRRGILLRPVDCARLASSDGRDRARVWLSDALHRLLAEPDQTDSFVRVRVAR